MPLVYVCLGLLLLVLRQPRGNNTCLYTRLTVDKTVHQIHYEKESWFVMTTMAMLPHDFNVVRFLLLALSITTIKKFPRKLQFLVLSAKLGASVYHFNQR